MMGIWKGLIKCLSINLRAGVFKLGNSMIQFVVRKSPGCAIRNGCTDKSYS